MWLLQFAARYRDKHRPEDLSECMKWIMKIIKGTQSQTEKETGQRKRILKKILCEA